MVAFLAGSLAMGLAERVAVVRRVGKATEALMVEVAEVADIMVAGKADVMAASAVEWMVATMVAKMVVVLAALVVAVEKMVEQREEVATVVDSRRCMSHHPLWLCCRN